MLQIRRMEPGDIVQVAALCEQWGYPVAVADLQDQFRYIDEVPNNRLFVAVSHPVVAGWAHAVGTYVLGSAPYVEVKGIVVHQDYRRQGIGRQLILEAERWAVENGFSTMRIRSGTERVEAYHFYPGIGYTRTKSQYVYQKVLTP